MPNGIVKGRPGEAGDGCEGWLIVCYRFAAGLAAPRVRVLA